MNFADYHKILMPERFNLQLQLAQEICAQRIENNQYDVFAGTGLRSGKHTAGRRLLDRINFTEKEHEAIFSTCPVFGKFPLAFKSGINVTPAYVNNQPHIDQRGSGINFALSGVFDSTSPFVLMSPDYKQSYLIEFNKSRPLALDGRVLHFGVNMTNSVPRAILTLSFEESYSELCSALG